MLRIVPSKNAAAAKDYFDDSLVHEDYVGAERPRTPGRWGGRGAELLGLSGDVTRRDFRKMCDNLRPSSGEPLTPRVRADRIVGWDFEVSVPKGVTLLHALGGDTGVWEAALASAHETMEDIQSDAMTRVRRGGVSADRATGILVWAAFPHHTARPVDGVADPQDHIHFYVFNATRDPVEERWKAVQLSKVRWSPPYFEALYLSRLALRLHDLGYETEPRGPYWEVKGLPPSLIDKFSGRRNQVEALATRLGIDDPKVKAGLGAVSRQRKRHTTPESLIAEWKNRLDESERRALHRVLNEREGTRSQGPDERHSEPELNGHRDAGTVRDAATPGDRSTLGGERRTGAGAERTNGSASRPRANASSEAKRSAPEASAKGATLDGRLVHDIARTAAARVFHRSAVVRERSLLTEALRAAPGAVTEHQLRAEFDKLGLITRERGGVTWVTTAEALQTEQRMVRLASEGRGSYRPLARKEVEAGTHALGPDQLKAVNHVLRSRDLVTLVEGRASTGESAVMQAVRAELQRGSGPLGTVLPDRLVVVGPTPATSRGVRNQPGYEDAETVSKFLADAGRKGVVRRLGERLLVDRVVWVREGSLLGTSSMVELMEQCRASGARLVVAHDPAQLRSVSRGSCIPVLKKHAGLTSAGMDEASLQREDFTEAVTALARGRTVEGFNRLTEMGAIRETDKKDTARRAAADYIQSQRSGKKTSLVAPTLEDKARLTREVRSQLRNDGRLRMTRRFKQLVPAKGTPEDRHHAEFYHRDQIVQFHQNARGFRAGSRWRVLGHDPFGHVTVSADRGIETRPYPKRPLFDVDVRALPLRKADRFEVYEQRDIRIAVGDMVRITKNGRAFSVIESVLYEATATQRYPTRHLNNGSVCRVKRFTVQGGLHLDNGLIVPKKYGHIEHGYCATPKQAGPADRVVLYQTRDSEAASSAEQFYSTLSNARESAAVYTDDAAALRQAVGRNAPRTPTAMDVVSVVIDDPRSQRILEKYREEERTRQSRAETTGDRERGFERERA